MTSNDEYTEHIETADDVVLTEKDQADLDKLLAGANEEEPEYHTVLRAWQEILKEENFTASSQEITARWATEVCGKYVGVTFADMPSHRDLYFDLIREMRAIVEAEIESDEDCLTHKSLEEDSLENREHYLNILMQWQLSFLEHELNWDCTAADAATRLSSLAEAHGMFFGATGLTGHLEAIRLEFTEADQEDLAIALQEFRETYVKGDNPEEVEGE